MSITTNVQVDKTIVIHLNVSSFEAIIHSLIGNKVPKEIREKLAKDLLYQANNDLALKLHEWKSVEDNL